MVLKEVLSLFIPPRVVLRGVLSLVMPPRVVLRRDIPPYMPSYMPPWYLVGMYTPVYASLYPVCRCLTPVHSPAVSPRVYAGLDVYTGWVDKCALLAGLSTVVGTVLRNVRKKRKGEKREKCA